MNKRSRKVIFKIIENVFINDYGITIPVKSYSELNGVSYTKLKLGMLDVNVICHSNSTENIFEISHGLAESLGISQGMVSNLIIKENELCLGPIIGIFVSNGTIRKANAQNPSFRLKETMKANKIANTIYYYFSIKDVNFINKKINGTYFNSNTDKWEQKLFPMPDVLYDRGGGTLKKQKVISKYIRKQLEINKDLKKINSRYYFDKWDTYKKLKTHEEISAHLPLTRLYTKPDDLLEMFKESPVIYMKKCYASNGRGVARIIKSSDGTFNFSYFRGKVIEYKLKNFDELVDRINKFIKNKKTIIQCAIDVIEINKCNVDMRATVQKNGNGELGVTAYPVRVGKKKCPITSTKSGSTVYMFEDFFRKYFKYSNKKIDELREKIDTVLFKSYKYIEEEYGNFGELGIDFAIDKCGEIWFIECNAKPGKDTVYLSYDEDTVIKSFLQPLEYAKYICGF